MKKYLSIAIVLLVILALCGCSAGAAIESASTVPSSSTPDESAATADVSASSEGSAAATLSEAPDYAAIGDALMDSESLSGVMIGQTTDEVIALLGEPTQKGEPETWGADGLEHQTWMYDDAGLELDIVSDGEELIVNNILADNTFTGKTVAGIGIGSSRDDVIAAYAGQIDPESDPENADTIVAGTVFGGIVFTIQDNAVDAIFIGAASE